MFRRNTPLIISLITLTFHFIAFGYHIQHVNKNKQTNKIFKMLLPVKFREG